MRAPRHPASLALLTPPSWLYGAAVGLRNRFYERAGASRRAALPVISVGNLTVGGTGKTPLVAWLAEHCLALGRRPAVVSRGYGGRAGRGPLVVSNGAGPRVGSAACGDEPYLLAWRVPRLVVIAGSDRLLGAEAARRAGADVVLLDDGFQHRRIARDLDLVLVDASDPFGNGRLLPAGPLREPLAALDRADLIVLTRAAAGRAVDDLATLIRRWNSHAPIVRARHRVLGFVDAAGQAVPPPRRAIAFCGIANPAPFAADLEAQGVEIVELRAHPDHHAYRPAALAALDARARELGAALVTTEKDLARLAPDGVAPWPAGATPLAALRIATAIDEPGPLVLAVARALGMAAP